MDNKDFALALESAAATAFAYAQANAEGHWYPCGFVWMTYRCRKNAKVAKVLLNDGWRWDDYEKAYTLTMSRFTNSQSMDYKAGIARAYLNSLQCAGMDGFSFRERID